MANRFLRAPAARQNEFDDPRRSELTRSRFYPSMEFVPLPLDIRKKPIDVKIHISTGAGVDITWSDAHTSHYEFPYLREHCPCATCRESHEKGQVDHGGVTPSPVLPMFRPRVTARAASAVGTYAVQIEFSDGHATGIFSFDHLREICPCNACAREFRG